MKNGIMLIFFGMKSYGAVTPFKPG